MSEGERERLVPSGAVSRGTFQLVEFDPDEHDKPFAVYENQAGVATLMGEGRTASAALADAGRELEDELGPRGGRR